MTNTPTTQTPAAETNPIEIWKAIPGYDGHYEASNLGRVRSLDRVSAGRRYKGRVLRSNPAATGGYLMVTLYLDGASEPLYVHAAVLLAFVGERPAGAQACHYDGNAKNNLVTNLRWDTRSANMKDAVRHGTIPSGEDCRFAKLTNREVEDIRRLYDHYNVTQRSLARQFNVTQATVSRAINRSTWAV